MTVKRFFVAMFLMLVFVCGCGKDNNGEDYSDGYVDLDQVADVVASYEDKMSSYISEGLSMDEIQTKTVEYIRTLDNVALVEESGSNITITYESGYETYIFFDTLSSDEDLSSSESVQVPNNDAKIEMLSSVNSAITKSTDLESLNNYILNNKVLVFDAFNDSFGSYSASNTIVPTLKESYFPLDINVLVDEECNVDVFDSLSDYGTIIFFTHGDSGERIYTGEKISFAVFALRVGTIILEDRDTEGLIKYVSIISQIDDVTFGVQGYVAVDYNYLDRVIKTDLPNTIVFNASCKSFKSSKLSDMFLKKGASAYLGFNPEVSTGFASSMATQFFSSMLPYSVYPKSLLESIPSCPYALIKGDEDDTTTWFRCDFLWDGNKDITYGYLKENYSSVDTNISFVYFISNLTMPTGSKVSMDVHSSGVEYEYTTTTTYSCFIVHNLEPGTTYTLKNLQIERSDGSIVPFTCDSITFTTLGQFEYPSWW